jgi:predicted lactoylglutathione lyase
MIGYIMLGTNDLARAESYYDALLGELNAKRVGNDPGRFTAWSNGKGPMLCATVPYDKQAATNGNGTMVALALGSRAEVDKFHAKALSLGSKDEGAPGVRGGNFYGGYFRDLDGNKFAAFFMG